MRLTKFIVPLLMAVVFAVNAQTVSAAVLTSPQNPSIGNVSPQLCLASIDASIAETESLKLFLNPALVATDAAIIGGSIAVAVPTALASLPAAATVLAARNLGAATYKEAKIGSQERVKQIVLDSLVYLQLETQNEQAEIYKYPALEELLIRVNGPVNTLLGRGYSAQQVAEMVVKASQDSNFCTNTGNYRLVHFKDYVLEHINS